MDDRIDPPESARDDHVAATGILDPIARAAEKQASRDADAARLAAGTITPADLARENSFFSCLDLASFRIVAIGKTRIGDVA